MEKDYGLFNNASTPCVASKYFTALLWTAFASGICVPLLQALVRVGLLVYGSSDDILDYDILIIYIVTWSIQPVSCVSAM